MAMLNAAPPSTASVSDVIVTGSKGVLHRHREAHRPTRLLDRHRISGLGDTIVGGTSVTVTWRVAARGRRLVVVDPFASPRLDHVTGVATSSEKLPVRGPG
ncbi:MAG: hypothetical protein R2726_17180 [Acidimicrobiales bacterium]